MMNAGRTKGVKDAEAVITALVKIAVSFGKLTKNTEELLQKVLNAPTLSPSWNHGKLLVVGGKILMTGGINFWPYYTANNSSNIIDMQSVVTGDAAISGHRYANYFWK